METSKSLHNGTDSIKKPFIVVEGFDILPSGGDYTGSNYLKSFADKGTDRIFDDYDIIYINWLNHNYHIQSNAYLLMEVIEYINAIKAHDAEMTVLYAESMGGLIASYALKTMENEGTRHDVKIFVSEDVPYLGANVPIGALHAAIDLLYNCKIGTRTLENICRTLSSFGVNTGSLIDYISLGREIISSPSVKQMLINYVAPSGLIDNSEHSIFMQDFYTLGFPVGDPGTRMKLLAISNGGTNDYVQSPLAVCSGSLAGADKSLFAFLTSLPLVNWWAPLFGVYFGIGGVYNGLIANLPGPNRISVDASIRPFLFGGDMVYDIDLLYTKKFLWLSSINSHLYSHTSFAPSGFGVDGATGSCYVLSSLNSIQLQQAVDTTILNSLHYEYAYSIRDSIMFVPSASALCIGKGQRQLTAQDYTNSFLNGISASETPFDDFFIESSASYHTALDSAKNDWLYNNIAYDIVSSCCPVTGDTLRVRGWNAPVIWSTSDTSIATVDVNGVLTVHDDGFVTLHASSTSGATTISINKRVMVGMPEFYLSYDLLDCNVLANSTDSEFWDFVNSTNVRFHWRVKRGNKLGAWTWSRLPYHYEELELGVQKTIYFEAANDNYTSPVISALLHRLAMLGVVIIDGDGNLHFDEALETPSMNSGTRGEDKKIELIFKLMGKTLFFDHYPSSREFYERLLEDESFSEIWKRIKPWGDKDEVMVEVTVFDKVNNEEQKGYLTFLYEEDFSKGEK